MNVSRPARIGLVVGQLTTGGAEGQLREVNGGIDHRRFEPIVYSLTSQVQPIGELLRREGVLVRVAPMRGWRRVPWLAKALAADHIDVVHAWLYIANAVAWSATRFYRGRPLITSARNCKVTSRVSQLANMLAFRGSDTIVVNSSDVAAYIARHYAAPPARIRVVYNGIDVDRFHPDPAAHREEPGPIVSVGRLVEQKNHALFIRAAAELAREFPAARFAIVGDGPLRAALEAQARALRIADRLAFLGQREDVDSVLRGAALFWLTSRWEGMPNVVLEAMASGVPVIATDVAGTRELIRPGVDGFVVSAADLDGFVRRSLELLQDPGRRRQLGAAARARAETFSTARMVATLSELYGEVLGRWN